jgi:hypothetical protein
MRGALISSVMEEYNLAFCYPGILHKGNLCGLAAWRENSCCLLFLLPG